jgi:hypothetical protein
LKRENEQLKRIKGRLDRKRCKGEEEEIKEGKGGRISAWRTEEKHKNQRKK